MKLLLSLVIMVLFVASAGTPRPLADAKYEKHLPQVTATAQAQSLSKPVVTPKATTTPPEQPKPAAQPPVCPDTQWIWAQDGQCHDKPVAAAPIAAVPAAQPVTNTQAAGDCSNQDNLHGMQYVFCHESGYRPTVTNAEGCVGLGQACPASKLYAVCPSLDVDCQISYFSGYAASRYGGWAGAENFWRSNHWW